jgi:hypothetical protein
MQFEENPHLRPPLRIKEEAEAWLFKMPGVRAVGLGPKFVKGRPIGRLAILVYVESKRPLAQLDSAEIIPESIGGIPTDVSEYRRSVPTQREVTINDCPTGVIEDMTAIKSGSTTTHLEIRSTAHGLFANTYVQIVAAETNSHEAFPVALVDDDTFRVPAQRNGQDMTPVTLPYVANSARWINPCRLDTLCCCPTGLITFVGTAGGKVSIGSAAHGLLNGDRVKIRKSKLLLEPPVHVVKVIDSDNFELVGANTADFTSNPGTWRWRKMGVAPAGLITKIQMSNPVVIRSRAHGLAKGDFVIIQTIPANISQRLDNHLNRAISPYPVEIVDADNFKLPGVDPTSWHIPDAENDVVGSWIKVIEDNKKYGKFWGGIRIEMKESETETVQRTASKPAASPLSRSTKDNEVNVHTEVKLSTGTLGCIAIDVATGKKVLLSNAHVLYSGTDNDEVHHPDYYTSSRSCSKHKIAVRMRQVHGIDPEHPDIDVDAAIARFDPDEGGYEPYIADIGAVEGTAKAEGPDFVNGNYRVWKRGAQTGITEGLVIDNAYTLNDRETGITWRNQLRIRPVMGEFQGFMSIHGDSGAVLVNAENKIVGLTSKAESGGFATANPIADVERAMKIRIWSINDPVAAGETPGEPGQGQTATVGIPVLFAATLAELSASEAGAQLAVIVQSHVAETLQLMDVSKKFAALWVRNHGPLLMQQLRRAIQVRSQPMPAFIEGRPLAELVSVIFDALRTFGSAQLAAHAAAHEPLVKQLLTFSYEEMLAFLKSSPPLSAKM